MDVAFVAYLKEKNPMPLFLCLKKVPPRLRLKKIMVWMCHKEETFVTKKRFSATESEKMVW